MGMVVKKHVAMEAKPRGFAGYLSAHARRQRSLRASDGVMPKRRRKLRLKMR